MIFVTVGTHEAPFDRLVRAAEAVAVELGEEVVVQAGYSRVVAAHCTVHDLLAPAEMEALAARASILVSHAGPASLRLAWQHGRVPIVVPRSPAHGEHVDDHQIVFARRIADRVHLVEDPGNLVAAVRSHEEQAGYVVRPALGSPDTIAAALADVVEDAIRSKPARTRRLRDTLTHLRWPGRTRS